VEVVDALEKRTMIVVDPSVSGAVVSIPVEQRHRRASGLGRHPRTGAVLEP